MRQAKRFRQALQGLTAVVVWVHEVAEDASRDGLSRQHLQDSVVVRLLDSGIRALGIGNVPEPPGNPWLNVFVQTVKVEELHVYSLTVRLDETVRLERRKNFRTIGTTWEVGAKGVVPAEAMPARIDRALEDLIDYFIYDHQLANQRDWPGGGL